MKRELTVSLLALGVATCVLLLHHFLSIERARKVSHLAAMPGRSIGSFQPATHVPGGAAQRFQLQVIDPGQGVPRTIQVDAILNVKEKVKNSISFSGGTSGFGGSFIGAGYSTNNIMGHGESISIQAQGGTRAYQYVFTFTEP